MKRLKILGFLSIFVILIVGLTVGFKKDISNFNLISYLANLGPIGTNPPQLLPYDVRTYSMKTDYFAPSASTDSLIGFNVSTRQYSHYAKPIIPVIPTNISAFTNDVGYLTSVPPITSAQIITALGYLPAPAITLTAGTNIGISQVGNNYTINNTYSPTINYAPNRVIGTSFTASATRPVIEVYRITCSATNPLLAGASSATITAEYSTNGGSTWNPIMINGNSNSVALTVTVQLTNGQSGNLVVPIQANYLTRLRSTVAGSATVTISEQVETIF